MASTGWFEISLLADFAAFLLEYPGLKSSSILRLGRYLIQSLLVEEELSLLGNLLLVMAMVRLLQVDLHPSCQIGLLGASQGSSKLYHLHKHERAQGIE